MLSVCLWGPWATATFTYCSPVFPAGSWGGGLSTQTPRWWLRVKAGKVKLEPPTPPLCPQTGGSLGGTGGTPWRQTGWVPEGQAAATGLEFLRVSTRNRCGWRHWGSAVSVCPGTAPPLPGQCGSGPVIPVSQETPPEWMPRAAWPFLPQPR